MNPSSTWRSPILGDLPADGPHPDLSAQLMLFGQFVGVWDMDIEFYDDAGQTAFKQPGIWSFDWVLDGRVIQDVLVYPPNDQPGAIAPGIRRIGTTLRYYHPRSHTWQVIFLGAVSGVTVILHGGQVGDEIQLASEPEPDGTLNRWMFTNITANSFLWMGYESSDGGTTWHLRQRMTGRRRPAPA
jgi:hypothetical protein